MIETLTTAKITAVDPPVQRLKNPGFEGAISRDVLSWNKFIGPSTQAYQETCSPVDWTVWWIEGLPEPGEPTKRVTGRPESTVVGQHFADQTRILGGAQAVKMFTRWRAHDMGILQRVRVDPDTRYQFSAWMHAMYSQADSWHDTVPREKDGSELLWAHDYLTVGIDPFGGLDPRSGNIAWCDPQEIYGKYREPLFAYGTSHGEFVTVFVRSWCTHALDHCDVYIDSASLVKLEVINPFEYDSTVHLFSPTTTKARALTIISDNWDKRSTYLCSADDAGHRTADMVTRTVLAYDVAGWGGADALTEFFDERYPAVILKIKD